MNKSSVEKFVEELKKNRSDVLKGKDDETRVTISAVHNLICTEEGEKEVKEYKSKSAVHNLIND